VGHCLVDQPDPYYWPFAASRRAAAHRTAACGVGVKSRERIKTTTSLEYDIDGTHMDIVVRPPVMTPSTQTLLLARSIDHVDSATALDLGTGSGLLAILMAKRGARRVIASDISSSATQLVASNAARNLVARTVHPVQADMLTAFTRNRFDLIVCNPPSTPAASPNGLRPNLYGGPSGRSHIEPLLRHAGSHLTLDGRLLLVHNSLANFPRSLELMEQQGLCWRELSSVRAPFRDEYYRQMAHLEKLRAEGAAEFTESGGCCSLTLSVLEVRWPATGSSSA